MLANAALPGCPRRPDQHRGLPVRQSGATVSHSSHPVVPAALRAVCRQNHSCHRTCVVGAVARGCRVVRSRPLVLCIFLLDEQRAGRASTAPLVLRLSRSTTGQTASLYCLWCCQRPWTCTAVRRPCWHKLNLSVCSRPHSATYHVCAKPPLPSLVSQGAVLGRGAVVCRGTTGAAASVHVGNLACKPTHWLRPTRLLWLRPAYRMCGCDFHHLWCFTPLMTRRQAVLTK